MERKSRRNRYAEGLPGYHDVLARLTGAPSGRSALTLRLWLAGLGFVLWVAAAVAAFTLVPDAPWLGWVLVLFALIAAANVAWVAYRKLRGEPG
ncbi:hypothetical protein GCM10027174_05270 [Salinifilum aidingensis]